MRFIIKANVISADGISANVEVKTDRTDGNDVGVAENVVKYTLGLTDEKVEITAIIAADGKEN